MFDFGALYFSVNYDGTLTWSMLHYACGCRVDMEFQMDGEMTPLGVGTFCSDEHEAWLADWRCFWPIEEEDKADEMFEDIQDEKEED